MKKRMCALVLGLAMTAALLSGCQASLGTENEYIKIPQYNKVEVDKIADLAEITDDDVDKKIEEIRQAAKTEEEVTDRAAELSDTVNIDFVGKMDGVEFTGGSAEGYEIELGSGMMIDGFEEGIVGHKIGDKFTMDVTFPEDYTRTEYAGKAATFDITLNSIKTYNVPELTDEFVQTVSTTSKTVDEYKKELKNKLEAEAKEEHSRTLGQAVVEKIKENMEVLSLPEERVAAREQEMIDYYNAAAAETGATLEDVAKSLGYTDEQEFLDKVRETAENYYQTIVMTEAIAEDAGIKITEENYNAELQKIVDEYGASYGYNTVEDLKAAEDETALKDVVLKNLVIEWLGEHCIQVAN